MRSILLATVLSIPLAALPQSGDTVKEIIARGVALHDQGDYDGALTEFKLAARQEPKNMEVQYELAHTYFVMKKYDRAIEHADVVIDSKAHPARQAYDLKGSALDMSGKKKEAIKCYEKGIGEYPDYHLMRFNLGLTLLSLDEFKKAEKSLVEALRLKSDHPGSHYVLGVCMNKQGARARAMLCFYNFLLLEQDGKRAASAYAMLSELMVQGVEKTGANSVSVSLALNDKESDSFQAAEMMVSLQQAMHVSGEDSTRTEMEHFIEQTRSFFTVLGELKGNDKKNNGFWWDFHVRTFYMLAQSGHLKTFCHVIRLPKQNPADADWVATHEDEVRDLVDWFTKQDRSF